jgi:hypothetical protein
MTALAAIGWMFATVFVVLLVRAGIRSFLFWRRWPRWKPTYQGQEIEAIHMSYHLSVNLHSDPAGPWQTWTWKVSERDNWQHAANYHNITIGAATTMKQACIRAVRCAEERAEHPVTRTPPTP